MFGEAQGRRAIMVPVSPGYWWPSKGTQRSIASYFMWSLYVSKVQLYIKSIFASPKQLNNGGLLLHITSWLQGEKEVLLGLLCQFGDLLACSGGNVGRFLLYGKKRFHGAWWFAPALDPRGLILQWEGEKKHLPCWGTQEPSQPPN